MNGTENLIFSDASFDPHSKKGVGAMLFIQHALPSAIKTMRKDGENIARLEFHTAIWALQEWKAHLPADAKPCPLTLIIDCAAIENLISRRPRLEENNYLSGKTKEALANADLYRVFLSLYDELNFKILRVKGHSRIAKQSDLERTFSTVDKAARQCLRIAL